MHRRRRKGPLAVAAGLATLHLFDQLEGLGLERLLAAHGDAAVVSEEQVAVVTEVAAELRRQCHASPLVELSLVYPDKHAPRPRSFCLEFPRTAASAVKSRDVPRRSPFFPQMPPMSTILPHFPTRSPPARTTR